MSKKTFAFTRIPGIKKVLPLILFVSGFLCLSIVIFPFVIPVLNFFIHPRPNLINPVSSSSFPIPVVVDSASGSTDDLTKASSWFVKSVILPPPVVTKITHFSLSVPQVALADVPVEVNGSDLKKNAIHYPGTPLPGEFGNTVIFGHSALPQFYRVGDPLTIFNPLTKVKVGDVVKINFDGVEYLYTVTKFAEVQPDQIEVLAQDFSAHELTLITCVPLGTYWHRLVIKAELTN